MWSRFAPLILAIAAACTPMHAQAMPAEAHCRVVAGEKFLRDTGGGNGLCAEIERAIAAQAPTARYRIEVTVLSSSRISAGLVVNDRKVPDQKFAVMDSTLNRASIQRFAKSLAAAVAGAAKA